MTYRYIRATQMLIALPLIGVRHRSRLSETMHVHVERLSVGVMHHVQAHLMSVSSDRTHNGRTVIVVGAMPASLVGTPTGRHGRHVDSLLASVLEHPIGLGTGVR